MSKDNKNLEQIHRKRPRQEISDDDYESATQKDEFNTTQYEFSSIPTHSK